MRNALVIRLALVTMALSVFFLTGCGRAEEKTDTRPTATNATPYPGTENSKFVQPGRPKGE